MESSSIATFLSAPGPFWMFNREERNAVAVLFGLLTRRGNLEALARVLEWKPDDLAEAEVSVEWTYLRDLWAYHAGQRDNDALRTAVLRCLQPAESAALAACSVVEFNAYFGAVPRASSLYIQSPSNWSVRRFDETIPSNDEFRRTCRFKWAFNVKPDLVVQTPSGQVLCVEAKWDSAEGWYPASEAEKAIFKRRELAYLSQTEVQRYLVTEVLGFTGEFAYLARNQFVTAAGRCVTWRELLQELDTSDSPAFVREWCAKEVTGGKELGKGAPSLEPE